jgi:hypothetical protein
MEEVLIKDLLKDNIELNQSIDKGISLGVERAKDENINFAVNYNIKNGNNTNIDDYNSRLVNGKLAPKEQKIINKYKDL